MSKKKIYFCKVCGKECRPRSHTKINIFCSRECVLEDINRKRLRVSTVCCKCGKEIVIQGVQRKNFERTGKAYCSLECASIPKAEGLKRAATEARQDPAWRKRASIRMKERNPMWMQGAKEKMIESSKGRTYFSARGGNGQITKPQIALHEATGMRIEYAVTTSSIKTLFSDVPHAYKVDLADPETKLAVEVDGESHNNPRQKSLDAKKTEVLNSLGWTVLRFTNEEVDSNLNACVQTITSTILKLKTITTIS